MRWVVICQNYSDPRLPSPRFETMAITVRKSIRNLVLASCTFFATAFVILWLLGPFFVLGCRLHIPFTQRSASIQANAGMMHVTVNHDIPALRWVWLHDVGVYPPKLRGQHLESYLSFEPPKSFDHKTAFGTKQWSVKWYDDQPPTRYTRFWFPVVVPMGFFCTISFGLLAHRRLKCIRAADGQITK